MSNEVSEASTIYYGLGGAECEAKDALAKVVTTTNGNTNRYVSCGKGRLNNVYDNNPHDHHKTKWVLRKVNEESFNLYLRFLKTKSSKFLLNAERFLN